MQELIKKVKERIKSKYMIGIGYDLIAKKELDWVLSELNEYQQNQEEKINTKIEQQEALIKEMLDLIILTDEKILCQDCRHKDIKNGCWNDCKTKINYKNIIQKAKEYIK